MCTKQELYKKLRYLELFVRHVLPELLGHPLEVAERNLAGLVVVEQPERLQDLFPRVLLALATAARTTANKHGISKYLVANSNSNSNSNDNNRNDNANNNSISVGRSGPFLPPVTPLSFANKKRKDFNRERANTWYVSPLSRRI